MLIDWFTVSFQIINFLILIALLKRFLYGPVLRAMDKRETEIAKRLCEAETAKNDAETKAFLLAQDKEDFFHLRNQMEIEAHEEINKWKEEHIDQIKAEIALKRSSWQQNLAEEQEAFLHRLKIHVSRQTFLIGQKVMADLADTRLEARLVEVFLKKVNQEPAEIVEDHIQKPDRLLVTTGFPLQPHLKKAVENQLGRYLSRFKGIDFHEDDTLGFGICLLAGDEKWEWNLSRYMQDIEKEIINKMDRVIRKNT